MNASNRLPISLQELERARPRLSRTERQTLDALLTPALLFRIQYKYDPCAFAYDCIKWREGDGPTLYQTEILEELVPRGRVAIRGPHGLGKCLEENEQVLLADGRYIRIGDLRGRCFGVLGLAEDGTVVPTLAWAADNGWQMCYRIRTRYGRELTRTGNHPLLTWDGWVPVEDLQIGQLVAMPTSLPVEGHRPLPVHEVKLLAYLIGEGSLGDRVGFAQQEGPVLDEMGDIVARYDCELVKYKKYSYRVTYRPNRGISLHRRSPNPIYELVRRYGLFGTRSRTKHVPSEIFEAPNDQIALFLNRLFAADGWAHASRKHAGHEIGYASMSRQLVIDVQRLLLRLGIVGRIRHRRVTFTYKGKKNTTWSWEYAIHDAENVARFARAVGIYGKEPVVEECLRRAEAKAKGIQCPVYQHWPKEVLGYILDRAKEQGILCKTVRKTIKVRSRSRKGARLSLEKVAAASVVVDDEKLDFFVQSGAGWDRIESIEAIGLCPTVAISVPGVHTFVNDLFEHNTALASWIILWATLTSDDCKVPTTASAWRQLTYYLWPEVHKWANRLDWEKIHRPPFDTRTELLTLSIRLGESMAFAVACENSATIEGAHAKRIVYIYDEAKTIPDATWNASEGAFSTAGEETGDEAYALAISTPGEPIGRFHDIHAHKPGYEDWWTRHVTLDEVIAANRMGLKWANQRRRQWGKDSPLYQNRVLGEFAEQLADGVIPLAHVEKAQQRWLEWQNNNFVGTFTGLGVDIGGGSGGDPSTLARCYDKTKIHSIEVRAWAKNPDTATMELAGRVKGILDAHGAYAIIDGIGIGAGVVHRGREQGADFRSFIASGGNDLRDQTGEIAFANNRAAMWWLARELLSDDSNGVCLPPDDVIDPSGETSLMGELISPKWKELSNSRIVIESKKDIKERIGGSTNLADACLQILTGPRVLGSFEAPSIGNLASEMERIRAQVVAEMKAEGITDRASRVGVAIASDEEITRSDPVATLRYIGPYPSLTIFLDSQPYIVDPGWSRQVDLPLAMEVAEGLPQLFEMETQHVM